jgi:hypothetical protein
MVAAMTKGHTEEPVRHDSTRLDSASPQGLDQRDSSAYEKPELVDLGTVAELTQQSKSDLAVDGASLRGRTS